MPSKLKKPCAVKSCPNLAETGQAYCEEHAKIMKREQDKRFNKSRINLYSGNYKWRKYSKSYLLKNPRCVKCGRPSTEVDHIIPIIDGGSFWDASNHQALCHSCHSIKTAEDVRKRRN